MNPSTLRTAPISSPSLSVVNTLSIEAELPNRRKSDPSDIPAQERVLQNDPRWRKYSISVEKTLQSFDNVNEWADFITFLAKLLKCLQSYTMFQIIPHKLTVAKRLSQCLNPALPTGVHQRALDVYIHILSAIGPDNLRRDLPAWSSGLFPFFQYAATSVKGIILGIYEKFYLPLQESLRPATKAFILALLPGLEEETGEFFEKVSELMDRISGTVSPTFFFQNVWLVLITAPKSRIPAINYLSRRLPKMQAEDRIADIVGQDVGLMIRGFAAALEDSQILVQRGVLDLLNTSFKLNSDDFKNTRREDQILLIKAASGVVLRRDLSLSRRLYTWLLGSSEVSEDQIDYLKEYGLELLKVALETEMKAQASETTDRQRPFKIFISLLDKWEIGGCLTEVLVLDCFGALRASLRPDDEHDELLMTGNMLAEVVDPFLTWKQLYTSVKSALTISSTAEAIELARFIVLTFRFHYEEVQKLHAPLVAFGILDLIEVSISQGGISLSSRNLVSAMEFTCELLQEVSPSFFESSQLSVKATEQHLGLQMADALYDASDMKSAPLGDINGQHLLTSAFSTTLRIAKICVQAVIDSSDSETIAISTQLLASTFTVLSSLSAASLHSLSSIRVDWNPDEVTNIFIKCIEKSKASVEAFPLHSTIVKSVLTLSKTPTLRPSMKKNQRTLVEGLTSKLLEYLQPECSPLFVEATRLLWGVQKLSDCRHVESLISERLASLDPTIRLPAFEAFGNLWRFTEDSHLPGVVLRIPMMMMLDSLKSETLSTRRAGEGWMRCSLKSYLRILDPLIFTLLDPSIKQHQASINVGGLDLSILLYRQTFDQSIVYHVLDALLSLAKFGGQGFIRIAKASFLKHTIDPAFRERVRAADLETYTYLDGLLTILVRFLRAEPTDSLGTSLGSLNYHIHSIVAELIQILISRGEVEITGLASIESALTSRLYLCVHRSELDLQNKLLHVLHSVVHSLSGTQRKQRRPSISHEKVDFKTEISHESMFLRVVSDAISLQYNNAALHHWIDFLLMTIPLYRQALSSVILPLIDCLVNRIHSLIAGFKIAYCSKKLSSGSEATDAEYTVLTNALERLVLIAITESVVVVGEEDSRSSERQVNESISSNNASGGLMSYMSGVLSGNDSEVSGHAPTKGKDAALFRIRDSVNLLLVSWDLSSELEISAGGEEETSHGYIASRVKVRARKALERLYKAAPAEIIESIIAYWEKNKAASNADAESRVFTMVDVLAPSAQVIVGTLCEKLTARNANLNSRNKSSLTISDEITFQFFETYLDRMDGPTAVAVWSVCLTFVREFLGTISTSRPFIFYCLRCFTALSEKVSQTSALEDRRMRRDLQETFLRLVDASVQLAGRAAEQGGWLRRTMVDGGLAGDGESITSDKVDDLDDEKRASTSVYQALEITQFLARRGLGDFRRFLIDADKTVTACTNMIYYLVSPTFKSRTRSFDIDSAVFELLIEMTRYPTNLKAWKSQVVDIFSDNRFFNSPPSSHSNWKPLIQALMTADKERLVELTAKVTTAPSANIFTNRELESLSKTLSLRRLTYTIFTGDKNKFLTQLPIIQEKLVDLLRSNVGDIVHAEVYLCLRVLFCRIDNHHLSGLWPVILTELLRLFESLADQPVQDGSDLLQLVLSACKFLDLTLVLQTEAFQIHEWMFVTDTVDAIYPPVIWSPQAIMDRLGEILSDSRSTISVPKSTNLSTPSTNAGKKGLRRPKLTLRKIEKISDLRIFFSSISLSNFESVCDSTSGKVDWEQVEKVLLEDIFEGERED